MQLSVVSTIYKSETFLERFILELIDAINEIQINNYEIVFILDGITDNSKEFLLNKKKEIPQIKIIELSRNFGHHYAIQAGLNYSKGDLIFLIDNDLETSPYVLVDFYNELVNNKELEVVYGYQNNRKGHFVERYFGKIFWKLINRISDTKIPPNILTERLMTKQYLNALMTLGDKNLFLGGIMHWVGFNQKGIPIIKGVREGRSTYTFNKRAKLMLQAITSFSGKPLEWLFYCGVAISISSSFFILFLIFKKIIYQDAVQLGWTSLIAVNMLILGVITTFLGIIGFYLFRVFSQVQGRPTYIVRKIIE